MHIADEDICQHRENSLYHLPIRLGTTLSPDAYGGLGSAVKTPTAVSIIATDVTGLLREKIRIMSNHTHLVLHVDAGRAKQWSWQEVVHQWHKIYQGNFLSQRFHSISWFMAALNEHIARRANIEDDVTGKYWVARFKSQALLDEAAVLSCMAYIDLNPIRANMAKTPETSDYTSIKERVEAAGKGSIPKTLARFQGAAKKEQLNVIPCSLEDYLELIDITGRIIRRDKRGVIAADCSPILQRLGIDAEAWLYIATNFERSNGVRQREIKGCIRRKA